jgi:hypothetical protein
MTQGPCLHQAESCWRVLRIRTPNPEVFPLESYVSWKSVVRLMVSKASEPVDSEEAEISRKNSEVGCIDELMALNSSASYLRR